MRIDTLPSGTIAVHNSATGTWSEGSAWTLTDVVTIGSGADTGAAAIGHATDLALDRSGCIHVLDRTAAEVKVFGSDGAYVRTIGRRGHGPGELALPSGMRFDPRDRLWILNAGNQRYSVFDTDGALLKEYPRHTAAMFVEWRDGVFSPTGELFDGVGRPGRNGWKWGCARYDTLAGDFVDTLPSPVLPEGTPFGWGRIVPIPSGWWVGAATAYRLWQLTRAGDTVRVIERAWEPGRLTSAERDSLRNAMRVLRQRAGGTASLPIPEHRRIFDNIVVDDRGYVWVQLSRASDEGVTTFDVFDPEGRYLGAVRAPIAVQTHPIPAVRGDRMAFAAMNELGAQFVVTARIQGRP